MSMIADLVTYFNSRTDLTDVVGNRIFFARVPSELNAYPCITFHKISTPSIEHHLLGPSGWQSVRIQVDSWGFDPAIVDDLSEAVRDSLDGFRGTMGNSFVGGSTYADGIAFYEPAGDGSDRGLYHNADDVILTYATFTPQFHYYAGGGVLSLTGAATSTNPTYWTGVGGLSFRGSASVH